MHAARSAHVAGSPRVIVRFTKTSRFPPELAYEDETLRPLSSFGRPGAIAASAPTTSVTAAACRCASAVSLCNASVWNDVPRSASWEILEADERSRSGSGFESSGAVASASATLSAAFVIALFTRPVNAFGSGSARSMWPGRIPPSVSRPPVVLVNVAASGWPIVPVFDLKSSMSSSERRVPTSASSPKPSASLYVSRASPPTIVSKAVNVTAPTVPSPPPWMVQMLSVCGPWRVSLPPAASNATGMPLAASVASAVKVSLPLPPTTTRRETAASGFHSCAPSTVTTSPFVSDTATAIVCEEPPSAVTVQVCGVGVAAAADPAIDGLATVGRASAAAVAAGIVVVVAAVASTSAVVVSAFAVAAVDSASLPDDVSSWGASAVGVIAPPSAFSGSGAVVALGTAMASSWEPALAIAASPFSGSAAVVALGTAVASSWEPALAIAAPGSLPPAEVLTLYELRSCGDIDERAPGPASGA